MSESLKNFGHTSNQHSLLVDSLALQGAFASDGKKFVATVAMAVADMNWGTGFDLRPAVA